MIKAVVAQTVVAQAKKAGVLLICLAALIAARSASDFSFDAKRIIFSAPISNTLLLQGQAGPMPGLLADFSVLDVFSVYHEMLENQQSQYAPLLAIHLNNASKLDPYFFDVYRLASSLLVYDAKMPEAGVALLDKASLILTENWEFPFFGGFIAHDQLGDDEQAFALMSRVIGRPNMPPLAINLAARFLNNYRSEEDALLFLQGLLQTMPEQYQAGIREKMLKLQQEHDQ